ncbi:MAG: CRISPR-associated endonuclease Cas1 [Candidatus Weimeria sp.]
MPILYVEENNAHIGLDGHRAVVDCEDGLKRYVPLETLDGITILGKPQLTTQFMEFCLRNGINIAFFSKNGKYFGRLASTGHVKAPLQRKQAALYENDFAIELSRKIIEAKIHNQMVLLRRYAGSKGIDCEDEIAMLRICSKKAMEAQAISEIIGFEGQGAKAYFKGLSLCVDPAFAFNGRNRQPPRDPFNSMLSLGYSIMMNEVYGEIEHRGMNPYFGFLHRDAEHHPTLASDMMEEWRAVIVDALVMSLINGHEVEPDGFEYGDEEQPGCFLKRETLKIFLQKLEKKMQTMVGYLDYVDYKVSFRRAISLQMQTLSTAIESGYVDAYHPVRIR